MSWFGHHEKTINTYVKGPLEIERDALVIKLNKQIDVQAKTNEQVNLLRFKVEVLVEMLAMEEKKYNTTAKRLEALKWAYELQTTQLREQQQKGQSGGENSYQGDESSSSSSNCHSPVVSEMPSAMTSMSEEFARNSSGIIIRFADDKGQLASSLGREEFVNTLLTITSSSVSPADCEAIAWRFYDHASQLVSVSEFVDYFVTPAVTRQARYAASAVRNSVNVLEMVAERCAVPPELAVSASQTSSLGYSLSAGAGASSASLLRNSLSSSHRAAAASSHSFLRDSKDSNSSSVDMATVHSQNLTLTPHLPSNQLELALLKLVAMWEVVEDSLVQQHLYGEAEDENRDENGNGTSVVTVIGGGGSGPLISSADLKAILTQVCSADSPLIQSHNMHASSITAATPSQTAAAVTVSTASQHLDPLLPADVALIVERFEMAGSVKKCHFVSYFRDIAVRLASIKEQMKKNPRGNKPPKPISRSTGSKDPDPVPEITNAETLIAVSASPFRGSAEWQQLKAASFARPLELEPLDRRFEDTVYGSLASELAEAKQLGKPLPLVDEGANEKVRRLNQQQQQTLAHALPTSRFVSSDSLDKQAAAALLDQLGTDEEDDNAEPKKKQPQQTSVTATTNSSSPKKSGGAPSPANFKTAALIAMQAVSKPPKPTPASKPVPTPATPAPVPVPVPAPRRVDYNRVLEHYSQHQAAFEQALSHQGRIVAIAATSEPVITPTVLLDFLVKECPRDTSSNTNAASSSSADPEIAFILDQLQLPATTGASTTETVAAFRRLLANYTDPRGPQQAVAVRPPPASPIPIPTPAATAAAVPAPVSTPAPVAAPTLTAAEREADDLLDRQIKAKKDLLSSTSEVILGYRDGAEFNQALRVRSAAAHPDPPNKAPFVTSDEFLLFITKRHPHSTANALKMFVNADMGSLISADGHQMLLKDIKNYLDKEVAITNKHVLELAALDKKKAKLQAERAERAANPGGSGGMSIMKTMGKFFGMSGKKQQQPSATATATATATTIAGTGTVTGGDGDGGRSMDVSNVSVQSNNNNNNNSNNNTSNSSNNSDRSNSNNSNNSNSSDHEPFARMSSS